MVWDVDVVAGLVAGVAAMVPGAVIYDPRVLGTAWMKETGHKPSDKSMASVAVAKMFVTSLINGLIGSVLINLSGAATVSEALAVMMIVAWFWLSASLMLVYFEGRSWRWFQISALSHILTAAVIGVVLGLFL